MDQTFESFSRVSFYDCQLRKSKDWSEPGQYWVGAYQPRVMVNGKIHSCRRCNFKTANDAADYGERLARRAHYLFNYPIFNQSDLS